MKTWIKVLVLILSSVVSFTCLFLVVALLLGINDLDCPATVITPVFALLGLAASIIIFCVWCYKFSACNKRKAMFITALCIFFVSILLLIISPTINQAISENEHSQSDISLYSEIEVITYLETNGYIFHATKNTSSTYTTKYIFTTNNENDISISRMSSPILGTCYLWKNEDINDKWAEIKNTYENDTIEKENQFSGYQKWLKHLGLSSRQLTDALDYYDETLAEYK